MNIALIGFMGVGKTTVSHLLGRLSGMPEVDVDRRIVEREGRPTPEIFETDGEADFRDMETGHMDNIRECIEGRAESLMEAQRETAPIIPIYQHTGEYAREHGELDAFLASLETNVACRDAIETAIREGFDGMSLHADTKGVLAAFGAERVSHVLAATLQGIRSDPRVSSGNQAWAATVPMFDTVSRHRDYLITSHPGVLSIFVTQTRKEMDAMQKQTEKKPSIKDQLSVKPVPGDQPAAKPKDREVR